MTAAALSFPCPLRVLRAELGTEATVKPIWEWKGRSFLPRAAGAECSGVCPEPRQHQQCICLNAGDSSGTGRSADPPLPWQHLCSRHRRGRTSFLLMVRVDPEPCYLGTWREAGAHPACGTPAPRGGPRPRPTPPRPGVLLREQYRPMSSGQRVLGRLVSVPQRLLVDRII